MNFDILDEEISWELLPLMMEFVESSKTANLCNCDIVLSVHAAIRAKIYHVRTAGS